MKRYFRISLYTLLALLWMGTSSCSDDDNGGVAKAVLASASNLTFASKGDPSQIITVYSDATWTCEHPDWIRVEPETGAGTTDVRISVVDNMRDGTPDNPRKADLVFKGATKASEARVVVRQDGDLFRDVMPITIEQMNASEDESVAVISNLTAVAQYGNSFMATDGSNNVLIRTEEPLANGTTFTVYSTKTFDEQNMSVLVADHFVVGGTPASLPEAIDVTEQLDAVSAPDRAYISMTGKVDGSNIIVSGKVFHGVAIAVIPELNLSSLNGHMVEIFGFYAGSATPAVNFYGHAANDQGVFEVIYFQDDFKWLDPWSVAGAAGKTVENDNLDAAAPALTSVKASADGTEMTAYNFIESKGYTLLYDKGDNKRIYLQRNYLKFGKTGNHGGLTLPPMEVPSDVEAELVFDWCPMRQGSGKIDPVHLYVKIENGSDVQQIDIPECGWESGHKLEWIRATVSLSGIKIDRSTKISISQTEWEVSTANRWFLDNIKVRQVD